ncbi:MAG: hypothetical protein F6K31_41710, partial [Symploca sp. SIO2G7]|nr:hypothetical protein [Symploca sp. SIO2G7]
QGQSEQSIPILKQSNLITVACCLLPVASFHQPTFNLVQDLSIKVRLSPTPARLIADYVEWKNKYLQ